MKVKICGLKYPENIREIIALNPDFAGFIFYEKSPRYCGNTLQNLDFIPANIKKIGVFVNESLKQILTVAYKFRLDGVQLHGAENLQLCQRLKETGLTVIKAFPIAESCNFRVTKRYEGVCDYFLFDTKSANYGGTGVKFDWNLLNDYSGKMQFLLSGGIAPDDAEGILKITHPQFAGIDLNSHFETRAGEKNVELLKEFLSDFSIQPQ